MAVFEYKAIAQSGKRVKGVIDAESAAAARRKLREQQLYPTRVAGSFDKEAAAGEGLKRGRVSQRDMALVTRQMAVLLQAGMPLVETLSAVINQTGNARLRKAIYDVRDQVNEGSRLADALAAHPRIFGDLYTNMVGAGESSGALEQVLFRLADIQERQVRLRNRVFSTLAYPAVMASVGFALILFLTTMIVPKIVQIFQRQERALPVPTKMLIATSSFLMQYWWFVLLIVAGLIVLWRAWLARPEGRRQWDRMRIQLPLVGKLSEKMVCARFARTLGTMLQSGLTMMTALDVVKTVVQNRIIEEAMDDVKAGVRRGKDLAEPLRETGVFPPMLVYMTELGQRSGELEGMLLKVADTYEEDVQLTVDALVSFLEPIMILVMGSFVAFLVFSILLPILEMSQGF